MLKIDCHAHILPETWPSLKEKYGYGGFIELDHYTPGRARMMRDDGHFFRDIERNCWDPEAILVDMDQHNVDVMVLCTVPVLFSYWARPKDTLDWSRFLNDHLAGVVASYPQRFIGLGTLPMQDVEYSIKELRRCKELGLPGVEIGTNVNGKNLDDKVFFPLWEAAQDLNMSIFVHPWDMMGSERTERYFLQWLVGMPAETTLAICSMLFGGVLDAFPKMKVMFAHAGGTFPFTLGRISHGYHARPDLCNINRVEDPTNYIGRFWVDSITHNADALRFLLALLGEEKIAYGTDYPFPLGDLEHGKFIHEMADLSPKVQQQLFSDNVLEFLGLRAEAYRRPRPGETVDSLFE
ncbi:MAG TPA: 2-amino-3-carboxymuconate-6-semialdehyde decarboxylase [Bacteroidetes bacterium]|nr:2-amino-3-carboxymuconate-6-semialdehyde decarboxylase [Bacteroidota bacterium]HRK03766.1 amidohydrolase family protein [Chlorobiota bacterium]